MTGELALTVHRLHNFLRELVQDGKGDYAIAVWLRDGGGATAKDLLVDMLVVDDDNQFVAFHYTKS